MNEAVTIGSGNHPVFLAKRLTPHHQHASSSINISKEAAEINNLGAISVLLQKEKASDENEQQEAQTQDALAQWKAKNKGQFDPDDMKFDDPLWYEAYMVWYAQQEDTQKNNEEAEIKRSNSKKALTDHNPFAEWMEQTNFAHWYCLSDIDKMAEYLELDRPACGKDTREGCQALTGYMIKAAKEQGHPDKPFFLECVAKKNDDDDCRMVLKNNAQKYLDLFPYKDTKHVELAMDYHVANPFWDAAQVTNFDRDAGRGTIAENEMQCVMKHPGLYNPPLSCRFEPLQTNRAGICYFNSALWASLYDNHAAWQALGENNDFDDQSGQNVLNTALNAVRDALRRIAVGLIAFKKMDEHTFAGAFLRAIRKTFCKNLNVDLGDDKNTKDDECDWFYFGEDESGGDPFTPYRLFEYAIYHELPTWINWYSSKQDLPKCNNFANMMSEKVSEANAPRKFIVNIKPCGWGDGTEFQPPDIALEDGTVYMAKVAMLDLAGTHATIAVRVEKKLEHDIYCGSDHCKADCNCPGARLVGWKWYNHDDREALMISDKVLAAGGANIKGLIYEKKDTIYDDSKIPKIENDDTGSGD